MSACRRQEASFQMTDGCRQAEEQMSQQNAVLLIGPPTSGIRAIAKHLLVKFAADGFEVIKVLSPEYIKTFLNPLKLQIFYVDNAFGCFPSIEKNVHGLPNIANAVCPWLNFGDELKAYMETGNIKLIATTSYIIYKHMQKDIGLIGLFADNVHVD